MPNDDTTLIGYTYIECRLTRMVKGEIVDEYPLIPEKDSDPSTIYPCLLVYNKYDI